VGDGGEEGMRIGKGSRWKGSKGERGGKEGRGEKKRGEVGRGVRV